MKLLLDAHAIIWAVDDPSKLGPQAATALSDAANQTFVSAGTIWELSIKVGLGKLSLSLPFAAWMNKSIVDLGASILPITIGHAAMQAEIQGRGDPFDRLLAAQAKVEELVVISSDAALDTYGAKRLW